MKSNSKKELRIELLQDQVRHDRIEKDELENKCREWKLDLLVDILLPIGYNTCDRCGNYGDSEYDFCWIDSVDWDMDNPNDKAVVNGINKEEADYCAVCWDCLKHLKEVGKNG